MIPPPSYAWKVSLPEFFWNQEEFPYEIFRRWVKKFSTETLDTPSLPPFIHKIFCYQKFSETLHRKVPLRKVSVLWDKIISTHNTRPLLLSLTFFFTKVFWNTEGFLYEMFRCCETKQFQRKFVISPPFWFLTFFFTTFFSNTEGFPYKVFRYRETEKFSTENRDKL